MDWEQELRISREREDLLEKDFRKIKDVEGGLEELSPCSSNRFQAARADKASS